MQDSLWLWLKHHELGWILVERGTVIYTDDAPRSTAPLSDELLERLRDGMLARQEDETAGGVAVDSGEVT